MEQIQLINKNINALFHMPVFPLQASWYIVLP
jgi:hypothetical protein